MLHINKKGFLLLDSLISVFITSIVCIMCYSIYNLIIKYDDGYKEYVNRTNLEMKMIYDSLADCEVCIIDESD